MKFRLKMDLSQFYDDERNLAYILVDPNWDQVACLQEHVQRLFDVPEVQFLTDDGVYIPLKESIDVIKSNDVLRAIIPQKSKKKKKKTSFIEDSIEINGDKRKCTDDVTLTSSTPNIQAKKKQRTSKKKEDDCSIKELEETIIKPIQNTSAVSSTIDSNDLNKAQLKNGQLEDTVKSRKRKRSRKNKKSLTDVDRDEKDSRLSSVPVPISSSTLRLSKSMSTPNSSGAKHVHFSDEEPTLIGMNSKSKEGFVTYRCSLTHDCEARTIKAEKTNDSEPKKPIIQIHENIVLVPAPKLDMSTTKIDQEDSVIEVDDSIAKSVVEESFQEINVDRILPLSEELTEMPNIGDIILFKIYQLSEECTPEISKYICGRCEEVDATNKTLYCFILDGLDQLDDNIPRLPRMGNLKNCFQFSFNEMLDKRVFRM